MVFRCLTRILSSFDWDPVSSILKLGCMLSHFSPINAGLKNQTSLDHSGSRLLGAPIPEASPGKGGEDASAGTTQGSAESRTRGDAREGGREGQRARRHQKYPLQILAERSLGFRTIKVIGFAWVYMY